MHPPPTVRRGPWLATPTAVGTSRRYRARPETLRGLHGALASPDKWVNADTSPESPESPDSPGDPVVDVRTKQVVVAQTIAEVSPAAAFAAFAAPVIFSRWLGVPVIIEDRRVAFTMEWGTSVRGWYEVLCPPDLIAMRWDFDDENVPVPGVELVSYLRVFPHPDGARVEIHQLVDTLVQAQFMERAWAVVLGRLRAGARAAGA